MSSAPVVAPAAADRLTVSAIQRYLATEWMGRDLRCFDEVDSTNMVARDAGRVGAREGTVVIAEAQSKGRGRRGRDWVSPAQRNLYLSVVLRPGDEIDILSVVSLVAGIAVCDAVREWDSRAMIKWPNDVLIEGRKVAGILAEVEGEGRDRLVILGVGVNLNADEDDFPEELRGKAGSVRLSTGTGVDRSRFTARVLVHLEQRYEELRAQGFGSLAGAWQARSCLNGRRVTVEAPTGQIVGIAAGLDEDGALRLHVNDGTEHRLLAGDVTVTEWS